MAHRPCNPLGARRRGDPTSRLSEQLLKPLPSVTVAIPVLNEGEHLGACLDAITAQTYSNVIEVLVVDGGSTDNTLDVARSRRDVEVLHNPRRIQAAALNIALERARGEVFVRVDGHGVVTRDHIARSVDALTTNGAVLVGAAMHPTGSTWFGRGVALAMRSRLGVGPAKFHHGGSGWVDHAFLGTFWTDIGRAVGGYSEEVGVNEDAEFAFRMRQRGGVWLERSTSVAYSPRESPRLLARQFFRYGVSRAATVRRHPRSLRGRQLAPPMLLLAIALHSRRRAIAGAYLVTVVARASVEAPRDRCGAGGMALAMPIMHLAWAIGFVSGLAGVRP